ncbi:MAG: transposase [Verrucomicrobiota bacterium]
MSANQFKYTDEFRDQAVDLLHSSGRPLKQVALELGVNASTLRSWRDRRIGTRSEGVAETQCAETLEMKVKRLERENAYLRRQREILKKAASILAEDPQGGMR